MKAKNLLLFLLLAFTGPVFSQQVDSTHYTDTVHYHLNYAATGIINNANGVHSYVLTNAMKFNISRKSATINLSGSWIYGEQQKQLMNNDFSSGLDFDLYKSLRHFYYWGLATYNTSYSLKVNGQIQTGVGVGYNVVDKKNMVLILSDGLLYENGDLYEIVYHADGTNSYQRSVYNTVRNSFRLLFHYNIRDLIVLDGTDFFQHSLSSFNDYIIRATQSVSLKLSKLLSFTTTLTYNKFTRTGAENLLLNFGLTLDKNF
ncbi:MAG: DUF481 domain-containing protein [Bacteroidetes bacterium]|nr:DUF481 domain-containing protein [Bacteroidota bacterium]